MLRLLYARRVGSTKVVYLRAGQYLDSWECVADRTDSMMNGSDAVLWGRRWARGVPC